MRVKTGETAVASMMIDIRYRCSSCGEENLAIGTLSGTAHTGTLMGVNLDRNIHDKAQRDVMDKFAGLVGQIDSHRYRTAGLTCKCKKCGHKEPWARMNYTHLDKPYAVSLALLIMSVFMSLVGLAEQPFNVMHFIFFSILVLSAIACFGIGFYKSKNNEKMEQLIDALPPESLPTIFPYTKQMHDMFNNRTNTSPQKTQVTYDKWVCKECGMHNSLQYAQCKKCGKYKSSN